MALAEHSMGSEAAQSLPALPQSPVPASTPIADLLASRDEGNRAIDALLQWLDQQAQHLPQGTASKVEGLLRQAMRAERSIKLKHSPRPLFAEMSSGREE